MQNEILIFSQIPANCLMVHLISLHQEEVKDKMNITL